MGPESALIERDGATGFAEAAISGLTQGVIEI